LSLLGQKIEAVQDCCASTANKSEDACSPCPVGEELLDLKRRAYLNVVGTYIPVGDGVPVVVTFTEGAETNKSSTEFLNLVGTNLFFGELEIDLQAKYDEFLALGDTICAYPAYFTTDETLCLLDIDNWDRGDRSIINLASSDDGLVLEMSEYTDTDCYLFGDFLIDELPQVFGGRIIIVPFTEDMMREARGAIEGLFAPSGAVVAMQSPDAPSLRAKGYLAKSDAYIPINTLIRLEYDNVEYRYYKDNETLLGNGYYARNGVEGKVSRKEKFNEGNHGGIKRFDKDFPWSIYDSDESVDVTAFKYLGCSGDYQCFWDATTTIDRLSPPKKNVHIPDGTPLHKCPFQLMFSFPELLKVVAGCNQLR
jgi:hypothetical protein